jgi:hypothetical protein
MEHRHRAKRFKNTLSYVHRGAPPNNMLHQLYSLGRLRWLVVVAIIEASAQIKKKVKKELNAYRRFEYSSDQGEQIYEQSPTSGVRFVSQECGSAGDLFRHCI